MKQLALTQQYLLLTLSKNGKMSAFAMGKFFYLSASGVLELLMDGTLEMDDKKLVVSHPLPESKKYLTPVYAFIESKQPIKFESVIEHFSVSLTDKYINELIHSIGDSLAQKGCARKDVKNGILNEQILYVPDEQDVDHIVQYIRCELLEEGELSQEIIALAMLLNKSGDLQRYFSNYEKKDLKARIKEIEKNPNNELIQRTVEHVYRLYCLFFIAIT